MVVHSIDDLNLHDSGIIGISISGDTIVIMLCYILDYDLCETSHKLLIFKKCWDANITVHFLQNMPHAIIGGEELLEGTRRRIRINSGNNTIEIVAEEIELTD